MKGFARLGLATLLVAVSCGRPSGGTVPEIEPALYQEMRGGEPAVSVARLEAEAPSPEPAKASRPSPVPAGRPKPVQAGGDLIAFSAVASGSPAGRLFLWDEALGDAYALPGPGPDAINATLYQDHRIVFNRGTGGIFSYDLLTEVTAEFNDVNQVGFVVRPSIAADGRTLAFVGNTDGKPGIRAETRAFLWRDSVVLSVPELDLAAKEHGGIGRVRLAPKAPVLTFETLDGRVFLYSLLSGSLAEVVQAKVVEDGFGHHAILNAGATQLAWTAGQTAPQRIYVVDVATTSTLAGPAYAPVGSPLPLPEANLGLSSPIATAPRFGAQGRIYFEAFRPDLGLFKAYRYEPALATVRLLTTLNATVPDESTIYAATAVP